MVVPGAVPKGGVDTGRKKFRGILLAYPEMLGDEEAIKRWRSNLEAHTCLHVVERPEDVDFRIVFSDSNHYAFADKAGNALRYGEVSAGQEMGAQQYAELSDWAGCKINGSVPERSHETAILAGGMKSNGRRTEDGMEPDEGTKARGYKDKDGMYRAHREDDAEAQRQFDQINEDMITYLPMCSAADSALKNALEESLRLDEYELSRLIGRDEAKAFHKRAMEQGCF